MFKIPEEYTGAVERQDLLRFYINDDDYIDLYFMPYDDGTLIAYQCIDYNSESGVYEELTCNYKEKFLATWLQEVKSYSYLATYMEGTHEKYDCNFDFPLEDFKGYLEYTYITEHKPKEEDKPKEITIGRYTIPVD